MATVPKHADLYLAHDHADGAKTAFPRLSALMWTNQWLQLASLEAIVVGQLDNQFAGKVPVTLERYWAKWFRYRNDDVSGTGRHAKRARYRAVVLL